MTGFSNSFLSVLYAQANWSKVELLELLRTEYPGLTDATLVWRIHDLKKRSVLHQIGRGSYTTVPAKEVFCPKITSGPLRLLQRAHSLLPSTGMCLTDTIWLNEFTEVSVSTTFILIEVEKAQLNTLFEALSDLSRKVFLNPDAKEVERFVRTHNRAIVIRPIVSEAPTIEIDELPISSLEKLLVDLIAYTDLYADFQPHIGPLFRQAAKKYQINQSRMRRYARRRDRLNEIDNLIEAKN